jgi:DNA-binding HxlR family transcriptional regulator
MVEILTFLRDVGEARHNEILKQGFVGSRETFAKRMRSLEDLRLIKRTVINSKPPGVSYSLTPKGHKVISLLRELEKILKG